MVREEEKSVLEEKRYLHQVINIHYPGAFRCNRWIIPIANSCHNDYRKVYSIDEFPVLIKWWRCFSSCATNVSFKNFAIPGCRNKIQWRGQNTEPKVQEMQPSESWLNKPQINRQATKVYNPKTPQKNLEWLLDLRLNCGDTFFSLSSELSSRSSRKSSVDPCPTWVLSPCCPIN